VPLESGILVATRERDSPQTANPQTVLSPAVTPQPIGLAMIRLLVIVFLILSAISLGYEYFHLERYACTGSHLSEYASPEVNTEYTEHLLINAASQNETYDVSAIKKTRPVRFEFSQNFKHYYEISPTGKLEHFTNPDIKLKSDNASKTVYDLDKLGKVPSTGQIDKTKISIIFDKYTPKIEMHYFYTILNLKTNKPETVSNEDVFAMCTRL
jgi:hypothetical protein